MPPPRQHVDVQTIRNRFNASDFAHRVEAGDLTRRDVAERRLTDETCRLRGESIGTRTQIIAFCDGQQRVALVHQYLHPDGTLGASQVPDPKELFVDGIIWFV